MQHFESCAGENYALHSNAANLCLPSGVLLIVQAVSKGWGLLGMCPEGLWGARGSHPSC